LGISQPAVVKAIEIAEAMEKNPELAKTKGNGQGKRRPRLESNSGGE